MEISCEVTSVPTPYKVLWYHDGEILDDDQGYTVIDEPRRSSRLGKLTKKAVSLGDSGEYKCKANNAAGSAVQIIKVYVTGE